MIAIVRSQPALYPGMDFLIQSAKGPQIALEPTACNGPGSPYPGRETIAWPVLRPRRMVCHQKQAGHTLSGKGLAAISVPVV